MGGKRTLTPSLRRLPFADEKDPSRRGARDAGTWLLGRLVACALCRLAMFRDRSQSGDLAAQSVRLTDATSKPIGGRQ